VARRKLHPQQTVEGKETEEAGLEHGPDNGCDVPLLSKDG
jgi:hypothetical protein